MKNLLYKARRQTALGAFVLLAGLLACAQPAEHRQSAPADWIRISVPLSSGTVACRTVEGIIPLPAEGLADRRLNAVVGEAIGRQLTLAPGEVLSSLSLTGYGAPSGNVRGNGVRGGLRLQRLKDRLAARLGVDRVTVAWVPEDWERIVGLTRRQPGLPLRQAALDIILHVPVAQGRLAQLRALAGGATWRQLQQQVFPAVRRVEYKATVARPDTAAVAGGVTLDGLYTSAAALPAGSANYYDIIDLAARLFPESAEAAVNAAGVALLRGNVERAEAYLRPWRHDSRAQLHLGVAWLLRGDRVRAEVCLRLALAEGAPQAEAALRAMGVAVEPVPALPATGGVRMAPAPIEQ